ncbi:hypothetical protein Bbelb_308090 [Branchiostoma belcheri]|nr:hypothetical protein Bbelb_308090 [Branchiostoma belcheri]
MGVDCGALWENDTTRSVSYERGRQPPSIVFKIDHLEKKQDNLTRLITEGFNGPCWISLSNVTGNYRLKDASIRSLKEHRSSPHVSGPVVKDVSPVGNISIPGRRAICAAERNEKLPALLGEDVAKRSQLQIASRVTTVPSADDITDSADTAVMGMSSAEVMRLASASDHRLRGHFYNGKVMFTC